MNNRVKMLFVFTLMGASAFAQDWNAIHAKLARADVKSVVNMLASKDVFEREAALAQIARDDKRPELTRAAADALDLKSWNEMLQRESRASGFAGSGAPLEIFDSNQVRAQLIAVLAERNDPAALPAIRKALGDADESVRMAAVTACGLMKDDKAADALIEMHRRSPATEELREALRRIPSPAIDRYLIKTLNTKVYTNRGAALDLLAARRYPGVLELAMNPRFFNEADMALARSAVAVIRTYAPEGGFRPLLDLARNIPPRTADLLLGTLTTTLGESADTLANERYIVSLLPSAHPEFVPLLTALLGASQGPLALSALTQRLEAGDVETRKDAARNLGKWTSEDALPPLLFAGKSDRDLGVQNLAWRMLVDVAKREDKMRVTNRAITILQEAIWTAPRRAERSAALDALKLYVKKDGGLKWLLDKIENERSELAGEVEDIKRELNIK